MRFLKNLFSVFVAIVVSGNLIAAEFEGSLTLTKITLYDTVYFRFRVLDEMVRIDQTNAQSETIQTLIIDLNSEKITVLSPNYKLYTQIQKLSSAESPQHTYKLTQTDNFKYINGYKCYQWRIRTENSETSYWVFNTGYMFFQKALYILSHTSDYANLFGIVPNLMSMGYIQILTVERTLLRDEKSKIIVNQIETASISRQIFEIPKNYKFLRY